MNTKLIVGASILMLALVPTSALGYSGSRTVVLPGGFDQATLGSASLAFCERVSDDVSNPSPSPLYCEATGFSAIFSDIGCSADFTATSTPILFGDGTPDIAPGCLDDVDGSGTAVTGNLGTDSDGVDNFASGTATIQFTDGLAGAARALVGNDRDDDGSVTDGDTDGSNDAADCNPVDSPTTAGDAFCYDDEFAEGSSNDLSNPLSIGFCFTRDREFFGGDFDDIVVFLSADLDALPAQPDVGTAQVDLSASSGSGCPGHSSRSGHNDLQYHGGGQPATGNAGFAPAGTIGIALVNGVADVTIDGTDMDCGVAVPPVGPGASPVVVDCTPNGTLKCQSAAAVLAGTPGSSGSVTCGPNTANLFGPADQDAVPGVGATLRCTASAPAGGAVYIICTFVLA